MRIPLRQKFMEMSRLYHFTSFEAACKIITSGKLRFGKLFRMNDLLESNKVSFQRILFDDLSNDKKNALFAESEMHRYQQISFSQDYEQNNGVVMGFDLHNMWGLYAKRGYGVCLVFDKDKLELGKGDYGRDVEYVNLTPTYYSFKNRSKSGIKSEIWRRKDYIFFYKRKEWEHEQEYRIIRRAKFETNDEYFDISKALSFVIICKDYSVDEGMAVREGDNYQDLKYLNRTLPILSFENGLDGYTLFDDWMVPIWSEQCGYM